MLSFKKNFKNNNKKNKHKNKNVNEHKNKNEDYNKNKILNAHKNPSFLTIIILIVVTIYFNGCSMLNPKTGALEGIVHRQIAESSEPLPDALISISGCTSTTYTDQEGYFLINDIPAGKRTLTIVKEGYKTFILLDIFIEPDVVNQAYSGQPIILEPKEDTILYDTAIEYLAQKDYQQALDTFNQLLNTYPDSPWADDAQYYIGYIYEINGLYIASRDAYALLLFYYPDSPWADDARLGIGNCYYFTFDYYNAQLQYQKVIDNYPLSDLNPLAYYRIAWCDRRLGFYYEGIQDFQELITLYPQSIYTPPAQYFIGEIYYDLKEYDLAILAFQTTINNYLYATWPGENRLIAPCAYFYIGYCYEKEERWQEAIDTYQIIIDEYPESTWDDGKSIAADAQGRIDFIRENYLPPEEIPEE